MSQKLEILRNGAVYTPDFLSDYVAEKTLQYVFKDSVLRKKANISRCTVEKHMQNVSFTFSGQ